MKNKIAEAKARLFAATKLWVTAKAGPKYKGVNKLVKKVMIKTSWVFSLKMTIVEGINLIKPAIKGIHKYQRTSFLPNLSAR